MPHMTVQQIIDVITSGQHPAVDTSLSNLVALYAHRLAAVSDKLTQEEMVDFLGIGVALAQKGLKEFRSDPADGPVQPAQPDQEKP